MKFSIITILIICAAVFLFQQQRIISDLKSQLSCANKAVIFCDSIKADKNHAIKLLVGCMEENYKYSSVNQVNDSTLAIDSTLYLVIK